LVLYGGSYLMIRFARMRLGVSIRFEKAGADTPKPVLFVMEGRFSLPQRSKGAAYQFLKVHVQSSP